MRRVGVALDWETDMKFRFDTHGSTFMHITIDGVPFPWNLGCINREEDWWYTKKMIRGEI